MEPQHKNGIVVVVIVVVVDNIAEMPYCAFDNIAEMGNEGESW